MTSNSLRVSDAQHETIPVLMAMGPHFKGLRMHLLIALAATWKSNVSKNQKVPLLASPQILAIVQKG